MWTSWKLDVFVGCVIQMNKVKKTLSMHYPDLIGKVEKKFG